MWPKWLDPCCAMKRRAVPLGKVPLVEAKASIAPAEQTEYNTEVPDYGGDVSDEGTGGAVAAVGEDGKAGIDKVIFGKISHKPVNLGWWKRGVHQVIIWVGSGRDNKFPVKGKGKAKGKGRER